MAPTKHLKPQELTLSNGIPVVLQHYEAPVAATYWWVNTGSADEAPSEAGFAHFLEHMLFKDAAAKESGRASTGRMARAIESLGGDINAYTSFEQTVYHVTSAAHHWEEVVDAFGTMAAPQKFLRSDFEREREVILEELRKNNDSPSRQLFQALFSATYKKHPYGKPVIGYPRTLKAAKVATLEAFYRRAYDPSRMGLILVGPLEDGTGKRVKGLMKLLEKRFGSRILAPRLKRKGLFARAAEPALRTRLESRVVPFDVKAPTIAISFRTPDLRHEDVPALDLMSGILGMGELGRLYQRLFYETSLVTNASGGLYIPREPGMLYFQAEMKDTSVLENVAFEMFKELARLRDEGPTDEELSRVLISAESEKLYASQTADGLAGRLGFLKYTMGDLDFDEQYLEELRAVDRKRVQQVASKYFDHRRMSLVVMVPKEEKEISIRSIVDRADEIFTGPEEPKEKVRVPSRAVGLVRGPEFINRASGIQLVFHERPHSHASAIYATALGGLRLELAQPISGPGTDHGSSHMMSMTWTKGTRTKNAKEIAAEIEGRAAGMDGSSGRNTVGLHLTGLARDWRSLSSIFSEVLVEATFPENEVSHSRRVVEDSIRSIRDHSAQLCSQLFLETLFENHPYGRPTLGTLESIQLIDSFKLRSFHSAWIRPERLVLSVVGAVKRVEAERWIEELEQRMGCGSASQPHASMVRLDDEPPLKAPRWVEKRLGREQTHIIVGGLGTRIGDEDRYAIRLLQNLLGGQSGRLFIELREKKSLAYTVAPIHMEGVERGYIGTYIACSPSKEKEALNGIRQVLERLAAKGPTTAEMQRSREYYLGHRAMELQSDYSLASYYALNAVYGLPYLPEEAIVRKIRSVTARDIQKVCRKYLVEPHQVTSIVG